MTDNTAGAGTPSNDAGEPNSTDVTAVPGTGTANPTDTPKDAASSQEPKATEPVVPESYDLKMPDGVQLDSAAADEFSAIAKELKLDNDAAQKIADVGAKMVQRQVESHAKLVESWTEQVKTDKDIGGDKLDANLGIARNAIDTFGSPELKALLNSTGIGNHPEVVKFAFKVGKAISEDGFVKGAPKGPASDPAKKMFPTMN